MNLFCHEVMHLAGEDKLKIKVKARSHNQHNKLDLILTGCLSLFSYLCFSLDIGFNHMSLKNYV